HIVGYHLDGGFAGRDRIPAPLGRGGRGGAGSGPAGAVRRAGEGRRDGEGGRAGVEGQDEAAAEADRPGALRGLLSPEGRGESAMLETATGALVFLAISAGLLGPLERFFPHGGVRRSAGASALCA